MYKFGKYPPRSMNSFGVAGLLREDCQVLFEGLFSPRHVGRVSDLIAARLQKSGADELRLRILLLMTFFECYRAQAAPAAELGTLAEPLVVECGIDSEKIAIGVSFNLPDNVKVNLNGLADRLKGGRPEGGFEQLLVQMQGAADKLVFRAQPAIRRYEVITLLALSAIDLKADTDPDRAHIVVMSTNIDDVPKAAFYTELGDLDYPKLLRDDARGARAPKTASGEMFARIAQERVQKDDIARVSAPAEESQALLQALRDRNRETDSGTTVVSGGASDMPDDTVIRVSGSAGAEGLDQTPIHVKGGSAQAVGSHEAKNSSAQNAHYEAQIRALQEKIAQLQGQAATVATVVSGASASPAPTAEESVAAVEEQSSDGGWLGKKIKKIWPFKKPVEAAKSEESTGLAGGPETTAGAGVPSVAVRGSASSGAATLSAPAAGVPQAPAQPPAQQNSATNDDPNVIANNLMLSVEGGSLDHLIKRAQNEGKAAAGGGAARAQKWVDGLISELMAEKGKIRDMAKRVGLSVRQKELEFKNKESSLQEELARRDDQLKQKNSALARTKDQLTQLQMKVERMKSSHQGAAMDGMYKKKFDHAKGMVTQLQEESTALKKKIEELKGALVTSSRTANSVTAQELSSMKEKYDRTRKEAEDYKIQLAQLQEKFDQQDRENRSAANRMDEFKDRLKKAMEVAVRTKRMMEKQQFRADQWEKEATKLKAQLAEVQAASDDRKAQRKKTGGAAKSQKKDEAA